MANEEENTLTTGAEVAVVAAEHVGRRIYAVRGQNVMLDSDLAELYGVPTKSLNLAVKRNKNRFPGDFMFQLTAEETAALRFQTETSNEGRGGRRTPPYAFTKQGVAMLSSVLRSERAVQVNIAIMRAFVSLRGAPAQDGDWARQDDTGIAFDSSTGYVLPNGAKRSPDASWVRRARLAALTPEQKQKFLPLCPDFVVELRSPSDSLADTQDKMAEYRDNGARLGWLVDAAERRVHVYRPGGEPDILDAPPSVAADPVLPGFTLDLARVWDPGF